MPNPFESLGRNTNSTLIVEVENVTDSILACSKCGEIVRTGKFIPDFELLFWECSKGHVTRIFYHDRD